MLFKNTKTLAVVLFDPKNTSIRSHARLSLHNDYEFEGFPSEEQGFRWKNKEFRYIAKIEKTKEVYPKYSVVLATVYRGKLLLTDFTVDPAA